jgi:hypothetical protein
MNTRRYETASRTLNMSSVKSNVRLCLNMSYGFVFFRERDVGQSYLIHFPLYLKPRFNNINDSNPPGFVAGSLSLSSFFIQRTITIILTMTGA